MDLIYKIYSVYLYDNQLNHDYIFFYNRKSDFMGYVNRDAPYLMFSGSYDFSANIQTYRMDKTDPDFIEQSIRLMKAAAQKSDIELIQAKDIITLIP